MKYLGMPAGLWILFKRSFKRKLTAILGFDSATASTITHKAKEKYKSIIESLPTFEENDRFASNIASCAMLIAFIVNMPSRPTPESLTEYYNASMMTPMMTWFCRKSGKNKFSDKDINSMKATAALRAGDRNPYSWNMEFYPYEDGSGYEARFTNCGICKLMRDFNLDEYIPAMCKLDYAMAEAGGVSDFVREYTLASGGPYCDCGYRKKALNIAPRDKE